MIRPLIIDQIDKTIETSTSYIEQRTSGRFGTVDAIAAAASPPATECTFELEIAKAQSALIDIAADVSTEIDRLAVELRDDEHEAEVFLAEHRRMRPPPFGTIPALGMVVLGGMLLESAATTPAYIQALGAPTAFAVAALICIGVAFPALLLGMGVVLIRHEHNIVYRVLGGTSVVGGFAGIVFALLCGAHYRELVLAKPILVRRPLESMEAILHSIHLSWSAPLVDPPNWGLLGAGAIAGAFTAWKLFNTFGYVGWRRIGLRRQERREAIVEASEEAQKAGATAKHNEVRAITRKVVKFKSNRRELVRARALSDAVVTSARTALAIGSKMRGDAVAVVVQAVRDIAPGSPGDLSLGDCPASQRQVDDRSAFNADVELAIERQDRAIAQEATALASLSEMYRAFVASLKRATERALNGDPGGSPGGPALNSPGAGGV